MAESTVKQFRGEYAPGKYVPEDMHFSLSERQASKLTRPRLRPTNDAVIDMTAPVGFIELIEIEKVGRLQQYAALGMTPSQMRATADNYDTNVKNNMMQLMTDKAFAIDVKTSNIIDAVRMGKPELLLNNNGLFNSVTYLHHSGMSYMDIADELRKRHTAELKAVEVQEAAQEKLNIGNEEAFNADAIRAMIIGDTAAFTAAVNRLNKTDKDAAANLEREYASAGQRRTESDPEAINFLLNKGINLGFGFLKSQRDLLSNADQKKFLDEIVALENAEFQMAKRIIAGELEVPENLQELKQTDENKGRAQIFSKIVGRLQKALIIATRTGQNFDAIATAEKLIKSQYTDFKAQEKIALIEKASGLIRLGNTKRKGFDPLDGTDLPLAAAYYGDLLQTLKDGEAKDGFRKKDIGTVTAILNGIKKAQGQ